MRFLAVDVGGTSTRALVFAADGQALGYGTAGSGNPTASGVEAAAAAIASAAGDAMRQAVVSAEDVALGLAGIAGAGGSAGVRLRDSLADAGLTMTFHFEGDLLATFCSGSLEPAGYVLVSGTGAIAARVVDGRLDAVRDGLGWLLGDRGSGFWIGRRVVRAALANLDRRQPPSALAELVLADIGLDPSPHQWIEGRSRALSEATDRLYELRPADLARFAPLAFLAADSGDAEASAIVEGAATELATTIAGVVEDGIAGPLVFGGSILSKRASMVAGVVEHLRLAGVTAAVTTVSDGMIGAAVLGLRRGGIAVDPDVHGRLGASLARLR